jgi:predicted acetyltransferase
MAWDVRPTTNLEEFADAVNAISHYFGSADPDLERTERFSRAGLPFERMHAAWDDGRIIGGAGAFPFELTVPGGTLPCAGVTVVGVLPTHRRRGVLTAMMRAQLEDVRSRGEVLAALWASEETIYGRFGYGLASLSGEIEVPRTYGLLREPADPAARTRLVSLQEAKELVPPIYDRVRLETPGMFARTEAWWELRNLSDPPERREGAGAKNAVVVELDGTAAGYALYRITMKWEGGSSVGYAQVVEAMADSPRAVRELWRYLLELDWVASIRASLLPIDHPLFLLLRTPRRMKLRVGDALWCRLVDVGAALSGRSYAATDEIVLDVADSFLPENAGRWRLAGGEASRTEADADLALNVTELGSVYLGGFTFAELRRAGLVRELTPGAVERADAVFRTDVRPWCPEIF